ncbi:MAG: hypothetical protein GY947_22330 [Rhodobacteraceae bacterium]|nr:hypothetical protein [Paracoccaceae bacterium]
MVAASDIIPAAEKCGFVGELSLMMILKVLGQLNVWRSRGLIINVGINVAADQLIASNFPDQLANILKECLTSTPVGHICRIA